MYQQDTTPIIISTAGTTPPLVAAFENLTTRQLVDMRHWLNDMAQRQASITYALLLSVFPHLTLSPKANPYPNIVPSNHWTLYHASFVFAHVGDIRLYFKEG